MNREEMLKKLQSISQPLLALRAYGDGGVTCDYMSSNGCGGFEILDWSDLDEYNYDNPNQAWEDMDDHELKEWIECLENGDYATIDELKTNSETDELENKSEV